MERAAGCNCILDGYPCQVEADAEDMGDAVDHYNPLNNDIHFAWYTRTTQRRLTYWNGTIMFW